MRQIVWCERKRFAQLSTENLECGGQFALDTGARCRFFQIWKMWNRIAERDPDRRAPQREPAFLLVEPDAADDHAWFDWSVGEVRQRRCARAQWCAFQVRAGAVAGVALWGNA